MKIRVKPKPGSPLERTRRLMKAIACAEDHPPIAEMEELIALCREDEELAEGVAEATHALLADDPPTLVPCWLVLVVGELSLAHRAPLLVALTASEGDAVDEALLPVLIRSAVALRDDVAEAIEAADPEDDLHRMALYSVLEGIVLAGSEDDKHWLAEQARRWVDMEASYPTECRIVQEPLYLLALLRHPDTGRLIEQVRAPLAPDDPTHPELNDVQAALDGEDFLGYARESFAGDWKDTARRIESMFQTACAEGGEGDGEEEDEGGEDEKAPS